MARSRLKNWHNVFAGCCYGMAYSAPAYAGGNLPFTSTLTVLKNAITGPFLMAAAMIMVVVTCVMLAFGEWGDGFKKLINIVLWLSIAFGASGFMSSLFGSGAGY
jgi:type IV secretory pathway VirB2 component (pilin)